MFPRIPHSLGHFEVTAELVANWGKAASSNCLVLRVFVLLAGESSVLNLAKAGRTGGWGNTILLWYDAKHLAGEKKKQV